MSAPRIVVDVESGVAPWRQVRDQLERFITGGVLPIGTRLPTIRQLAGDLGLAAGTVARAYRELESVGVLRTGRRQGTVVAALPSHSPDPLALAAAEYVAVARSLGASEHQAIDAVRLAYE
ncbi:GntR family transcriptional regulator [Lentzea sp. NBRC 105346]|uniref:GntR family transcriptional regulator n=1 Tax=Lentzea sp. NBRC 105346 TaxID=3032205 RepID=UPI0024A5A775|nr:GntR family transcriptional regulator [Lentzea sp. NBRC 105346]GLZ33126.1 GntR family transcriptional regulator [Lentzea sp. NBRC 105346]